jgi:hypothetical protein
MPNPKRRRLNNLARIQRSTFRCLNKVPTQMNQGRKGKVKAGRIIAEFVVQDVTIIR